MEDQRLAWLPEGRANPPLLSLSVGGNVPRQLTLGELRQIRRDFVAAASRAKQAGFDGVELHAAHLYLLSAFLSPFTNKRTDEYGGSVTHRTRLIQETIEEIKTELGAEWPVWVRMQCVRGPRTRIESGGGPGSGKDS